MTEPGANDNERLPDVRWESGILFGLGMWLLIIVLAVSAGAGLTSIIAATIP